MKHTIAFWVGLAAAVSGLTGCYGGFLPVPMPQPVPRPPAANVVPNDGFELGGCANTPVVCGWGAGDGSISQDTANPHSGGASMHISASIEVDCFPDGCDPEAGGIPTATAGASTDPASCAAMGPGTRPASFWYRNAVGDHVQMGGTFFQTTDCTGSPISGSVGPSAASTNSPAWQQVTGILLAPPGTQSAVFNISVDQPCYVCTVEANFDDLYVDETGDATPPTITSFTPTSGPLGTQVSITGDHFNGASQVIIGGQPAAEFTVNSPTSITTWLPKGWYLPQGSSGPITVTTPFGTATSASSFTVTCESPGPTITSFSPTSGPPGTTVEITGTNFSSVHDVSVGGYIAGSFTINSPTSITATVHQYANPGPGAVDVQTSSFGCTASSRFTVIWLPPSISSFSPASAPVGTQVDIYGTGFNHLNSVTFNGTRGWYLWVHSQSWLTATVPPGATSGPISVTAYDTTGGPDSTASSSSSFSVLP